MHCKPGASDSSGKGTEADQNTEERKGKKKCFHPQNPPPDGQPPWPFNPGTIGSPIL